MANIMVLCLLFISILEGVVSIARLRIVRIEVSTDEYEAIFNHNIHIYWNIQGIDCAYRCFIMGYVIKVAVSDELNNLCSCMERFVNRHNLTETEDFHAKVILIDLQRAGREDEEQDAHSSIT